MTWDELLKLGAAALGVLVTAALGYGARALEAHQASKRAHKGEMRKAGVERAEALMLELDGFVTDLSEQKQRFRGLDLFHIDEDRRERAARLARLMPDAELRSLLVAGVQGVASAWLVVPTDDRVALDMQRSAFDAMQEALSCYLTSEPIPPYLHDQAWRVGKIIDPHGAKQALSRWGQPRHRGLARLVTRPRRWRQKGVSSL